MISIITANGRLACFAAILLANATLAYAEQDNSTEQVRGTRPNVIIVFMDDMAYGDIGAFGATEYPTPHLDQLASGGRTFTDFVVSSAVCSASRSAILTGCYHRRLGLSGALGPKSNVGLDPAETTIAEVCKSVGYRTACFGKWHLGHHEKFLPHHQGFDLFYGIPYSNDMWPLHPSTILRQRKDPSAPGNWPPLPIMEGVAGSPVSIVNDNVRPTDQEQMTVELTRRSVAFIEDRSSNDPFFLYLPHPMVHVPLYVSEKFKGQSGAGLFGDVMMEVDWSIGEIMSAIKNVGQENNTLVVFTSDNGPWLAYGDHAGNTRGLREGKGTMWEGGYREPCVMHWPSVIPAGTTCDKLASTIDLLPTIAELAGADLPDQPIDGKSILDLMMGVANSVSPHASFAGYYQGGQLQIVRNERFKLVFPHRYRTLDGGDGGKDGMPVNYLNKQTKLELYDLDRDVNETTNVIDQYPEVVMELEVEAAKYRTLFGDTLRKQNGNAVRGPGKL